MTAPGAQPTAASAQPTVAVASATGTPNKPGAAVATADSTTGVAAGISGDAAAAATAGDTTIATAAVPATAAAAAADDDAAAEEPAAPAGPKVLRPGVYVIADPPPPPKVKPMAPNATAAGNGTAAGRNATAGPPMPTPGKNLMVRGTTPHWLPPTPSLWAPQLCCCPYPPLSPPPFVTLLPANYP